MIIKQYIPQFVKCIKKGDIREIADKRTGAVCGLARVKRVDVKRRIASLEVIELDRNGRERTK